MKHSLAYMAIALCLIFPSCTGKKTIQEKAPVQVDGLEQERQKALSKTQSEARDKLFDSIKPTFHAIGELFCKENGLTIATDPYKITKYDLREYSLDDQPTLGFYETTEGMFLYSLRFENNFTSYFPDYDLISIGNTLQDAAALFGKADTTQSHPNMYYNGGGDHFISFEDKDDDQVIDGIVIGQCGW